MSLSEEDAQLTLFDAVKNNNESAISELLSNGADVNITDEDWKRTPLFYAVLGNFENVVHVLIKAGANVNVKDKEGNSCLLFAVLGDQQNIISALIDAKADVNAIDKFQKRTPLFYAVSNKNAEVVNALLDSGADVNKTDNDGRTALFYALRNGNESIVRALIDAGADVNKTDNDGETAWFSACPVIDDYDIDSIVRALIDAGNDVNKTEICGETALFSAITNGNESIVRALIDAGVEVNKTDKYGKTALFIAAGNVYADNERIVRALIDAGADVNQTDNDAKTALFSAVRYGNESFVRALFDAGADVNKSDNDGKTALFIAAGNEYVDDERIVRALIDVGVDVNKTNKHGQTALFISAGNDNKSVVRALIDAGADVNKSDNDGETALLVAVRNEYENDSIVLALIDAGADVNKSDNDGKTALLVAVAVRNEYDNDSIVLALIDAGADVNKSDNDGKTALLVAARNVYANNDSIVLALIDAGADVNKSDNDGKTALLVAVAVRNEYDNDSIVLALIDAGADVNKSDNDGKTALFTAAGNVYADNESIVRALIDAGADVNKTNNDGETALFSAVRNDKESIVRVLIDDGAIVNKIYDNGECGLLDVSGDNHQGAISLLNGASNLTDNLTDNKEKTPFQARLGLGSHVKALVKEGKALINARNCYGRTPLFYALQSSPTVARVLLENDGNLSLKDNCHLSILSFFIEDMLNLKKFVFMRSSTINLSEHLDLLLRKGVTANLVEKALIEVLFCRIVFTCTPLGKVKSSYSSLMSKEYLSEFLSIADESTRKTIENMMEVSSEQLSQVVPVFVNLGADPNSADSHGNRFLHYVTLLPFVCVSQTEIMKTCHLLRKYGATMNMRNHQGQTPLLFCLSELSLHSEWLPKTDGVKILIEICGLLVNCGTNVNDTLPNGKSVFHLIIDLFQQGLRLQDEAVRQGVLNEMFNLLQLFSDENAKPAKRFTNGRVHLYLLLHSWASLTLPSSQNYSSKVILNYTFEELLKAILQLLLKCGAEPNARDDNERTPLHHCKTWSAVKLLIDGGANTNDVDSSGRPPLLAAAERKTFLERSHFFYPDVSEDPKTFWRTAIKRNLDPWTIDQHENSVLSFMIKYKAFVLAKALIEVTCEDKHIESDSIAYPLLNVICKDQSTHTRWKTNLVEIILNSRQKLLLVNLHVPLSFCCKNIVDFVGRSHDISSDISDDSSSDFSEFSLHPSKGKKRKFVDDKFESEYACGNAQPLVKKRKKDGPCSDLEIGETENKDLASSDSVHCEIAELLLSYGADCRKSDSTGESCLDLADTCPELKHLLMKPIDINKISKNIPWESVSKRYKNTLAKVSRGQEKEIVGSFWYHKDYIGSGAYGHVFTGINEKDGREVAIKKIVKLRMVRPEDEREITNLAKLADCKQVVSYVSFLEDKDFSYIVLELMEGDLEHYFNEGPVDESKSVLLCKDVIEGLRYLREQKIVHRDLKPGNVLYKTHPRLCLKIADFGLSRYCVNNTSTTVYGRTVVGTRCWIAPEILTSESGEIFTENSDTFSCGLLLHYILSKQKHPFSTESSSSDPHIIEANIRSDKMDGWDTQLSPEATDLLKKMLKKSAEERIKPTDALAHPFFWTKSKIKDFLVAVGNQPEFELSPSHRKFPETDLEKDINSSMTFKKVVKCESWDDARNKLMPKFYDEMEKRRNYDTKSIVDLVRLIRNGYAHFDTLSHKIRRMLLANFAYLDYFPDLVMEVFKAVTAHKWDSRPQIKDAMTK